MKPMKITNETLARAQTLEAVIKSAETELSAIREALKAKGSFATQDYVVAVTEQSRTCVAGLPKFEAAGFSEAVLEKKGLINRICFKVVKIASRVA